MSQKKEAIILVRVPVTMKETIRKMIQMDLHFTEAEFVRDAIREKIAREAPDLYKELYKSKK